MLCHILQNFRLNPDLRILQSDDLLQHGSSELNFIGAGDLIGVLNQILEHFVKISPQLQMILPLQNL